MSLSEQFREAMEARGRDPDTGELTPAEAARRAPASGLSDERLAERVREIVSEMCKGDRWRMCVPVQPDDSDVAIIELLDRYQRTRSDAALVDWLEDRGVVSIYFADGSQWNPALLTLRASLAASAGLSRVPEERTRT